MHAASVPGAQHSVRPTASRHEQLRAPAPESWRDLLRAERHRLRLTQAAAAHLVGVSPETLRKYERGSRTPTRETLLRIIQVLGIPQVQARAILVSAGFASDETLFPTARFPHYFYTIEELQHVVEEVPWPQFVTNDMAEVVAANTVAQTLWGVDLPRELARRPRAHQNILSVAAERHFAARIANWDECVSVLIGVLKGLPREALELDRPNTLLRDVLDAFVANDPASVPRLLAIWEQTPPRVPKVRWNYHVVWHEPGTGEIDFLALVTTASEPDGLAFHDWVPVNAASMARLHAITADRSPTASVISGAARGVAPGPHADPVDVRPRDRREDSTNPTQHHLPADDGSPAKH